MTGDDGPAGSEYDQPRVPTPLRERVDELFLEQRGYEAASFQEALHVVLDLAESSVDSEAASERTEPESPQSIEDGSASEHADDEDPSSATETDTTDDGPGSTDEVPDSTDDEPDAGLSDPSVADPDEGSVSFDEYVEGLEETRQNPSPAVESILDTEHADDAVRELAAEVLDEMTNDAFQELEHGVDEGVAGVTDGMGGTRTADGAGTAPSGSSGDGVPDSLTADPESDCAVCGRSHPVSVLQTSIRDEDGSVELVCPSCAE